MKNVVVTGFYDTGSSAVIDFLKDLPNIYAADIDEVRFVQDPNGISDLEYNLVENNHRHNSAQAIKRFLRFVNTIEPKNKKAKKSAYGRMFNCQFNKLAHEYASSLIDFEFKGYNHIDLYNLNWFESLSFRIRFKINKLLKKPYSFNYFPKKIDYCSWPSEEKFLKVTNDFINKLSQAALKNKETEIIVYDQLFPASNLERYMRYLNTAKVIVVFRDPRDIYTEMVKRFHDHIIPYANIKQFCLWYRKTRESSIPPNDKNILLLDFENIVLNFENTSKRILAFLDIDFDMTKYVGKNFIIEKSKKNTQIYKQYPELKKDIDYIEKELAEFLYHFE